MDYMSYVVEMYIIVVIFIDETTSNTTFISQ